MTDRPVFKAKVDHMGRGEIFIDGKDISNMVKAFTIESSVDNVSKVTIELVAAQLDLEIEADVETLPAPGEDVT